MSVVMRCLTTACSRRALRKVPGTIDLFEIAQIFGYFQESDSDADTSNHGWTPG
jgi:hypothetical protein